MNIFSNSVIKQLGKQGSRPAFLAVSQIEMYSHIWLPIRPNVCTVTIGSFGQRILLWGSAFIGMLGGKHRLDSKNRTWFWGCGGNHK